MSSDFKLLGYLIISFAVGIYCITSGLRDYLFLQKVKNTPTSKAGSAAVGFVELSGEAEDAKSEKSPVSGVPCTYWRILGEYYQSGRHGGWRQIYSAQSNTEFYLQDDSGKIPVEPAGADVEISPDQIFEGYIAERGTLLKEPATMDERAMRYIHSLEKKEQDRFMAYKYENIRITESYVVKNEPLYVLGSAVPVENTRGPVASETLEVMEGKTDNTLYFSDTTEQKVIERHSSWLNLRIFGGLAVSSFSLFCILVVLELVRDAVFALGFTLGILGICFLLNKLGVW